MLSYRRLSCRCTFFGELRDWIPIGGSETITGEEFSGNVLRYGAGFGYDLLNYRTCCESKSLTVVTEFVGWSRIPTDSRSIPLGLVHRLGQEHQQALDDADATIVNVKVGLRASYNGRSLYGGYGRALTGDTWYEDILRFEYRNRLLDK